jgi:hypothetical protein
VLSFVSVDLLTGRVLADLEDLIFSGTLKETYGRPESLTVSLPVSSAPEGWVTATRPYSVAIVCLADDGARPLWGAIVTNRKTGLGENIELSMATVPEYFDRQFLGNETFTARPQNLMVKDLVEKYAKNARAVGMFGLPLRVQIEGGNGVARDKKYYDSEDKSLLSALQDLSGLEGGPEWVVEWENVNQLITPVLRVADRIGATAPVGLLPGVQFTAPGCVQSAVYEESYKAGDGANDIMATSSGSSDARPQSNRQRTLNDGRPTVEFRWSPSSSITQTATLDSHARRVRDAFADGMSTLALVANRYEAPELGSEWRLGDDVYVDLTSPAWAGGLTGVARVVGWELTETTVSPVLLLSQATVSWLLS